MERGRRGRQEGDMEGEREREAGREGGARAKPGNQLVDNDIEWGICYCFRYSFPVLKFSTADTNSPHLCMFVYHIY